MAPDAISPRATAPDAMTPRETAPDAMTPTAIFPEAMMPTASSPEATRPQRKPLPVFNKGKPPTLTTFSLASPGSSPTIRCAPFSRFPTAFLEYSISTFDPAGFKHARAR